MSRKLDADLLSRSEIDKLVSVCSRRAPTGIRNAALIVLLWRTGLRINEALNLNVKDVDFEGQVIVVQCGKGGKRRVVGLDAGTTAFIERWLAARKKRKIRPTAPLFCTLDGGHIDSSYVRHMLPRLARKADIEKRVHAHMFRHRHACDLVQEGAPLTTLQALLGHSSAATTARYLTRIGASEAVEFARSRSWDAA